MDGRNVVVEVSAGVGGQEAMLFCQEMFNMYLSYALHRGWEEEVTEYEATDIGEFLPLILVDISPVCLGHHLFVEALASYCIDTASFSEQHTFITNTPTGGLRHGSIVLNGDSVYSSLKYEGGIHRVQRVPKTEKAGRVHTSTVSVAVLPQPTEVSHCNHRQNCLQTVYAFSETGLPSYRVYTGAALFIHLFMYIFVKGECV